jgi:selenocysteine-specific elongation factor
MTTFCLDAAVEFEPPVAKGPILVQLRLKGAEIPASFYFYPKKDPAGDKTTYVQVHSREPLSVQWKEPFTFKKKEKGEVWVAGMVLAPVSEKMIPRRMKRRMKFLRQLRGDEKQMVFALAEYKGTQGVWEKDILNFSPLSHKSILQLCLELEADGQIRILGFSPLFFISQPSFIFLSEKITNYLERYHENHPERMGVRRSKIQKRFHLHPRILSLTMKYLVQDGQIMERGETVSLSRFQMSLQPEEKKIMDRLEDMILKGEFQSVSMEELQKALRLSKSRLQEIMLILVERQKIVLGKDGFILHSRWLEEIIVRVRKSRKKELTVSEFKEMTGLSRKFAIPLLELLDQMGITRRRGTVREIL